MVILEVMASLMRFRHEKPILQQRQKEKKKQVKEEEDDENDANDLILIHNNKKQSTSLNNIKASQEVSTLSSSVSTHFSTLLSVTLVA